MPIPWAGDRPPYAFGPGPASRGSRSRSTGTRLSVEAQEKDEQRSRRSRSTAGRWPPGASTRWARATPSSVLTADRDVLALRRGGLTVVLNAGPEAVELPAGEVVIASGEVTDGLLPPDTAVWLR